ncbi:Tricalbin-2 [Cryptotrichosporon argae]
MMTDVRVRTDLPNGNGNGVNGVHVNGNAANAANADVGGMTGAEKAGVSSLLAADAANGASVHSFDPDATPEQKAAAAGKAKEQLAALPGAHRTHEDGRAVTVDTSKGGPAPTVSLNDIDLASRTEGQFAGVDVPGSIPTGAAPAVPTWMLTGWRQVAGLDAAAVRDSRLAEQTSILTEYLTEQMYGAWFHNAGIIIFAVVLTRLVTVLGLGWGWICLILASCASYYSLSIARTRARARDDMQRELVKTRLVTETESADWLNGFLDRFWLIYEPVLSQTIVASVDAVLAANTPSFLESIRLTTFTLGTKAPRIDYVRTFPKTPEDVVIMDWALSFTPNDLLDITPRQAAKRVNPKIVLSIRVGKGAVSKSLPVLLEDMSFTGKMRIKLKLMSNFPHVQTVDMSFIEKPTFDYVLKPLGGDTFGFDINNIPGLAPFIRDQVHANLGPMMYDPNVFTIDLQALLSGTPLDAAIGVLKITVNDARGLKAVKIGGGAPDPYVTVSLGAKPPVAKTRTIESTSNPSWQESHFILINTLADVLNLSLYDYNDHRPDNLLGAVTHELATLGEDAEQEGIVGKIIGGGKDRGELRYDLSYFPVLQPAKAADGTLEPLPETATGIVRLTIHQAKDLDISRARGDLNSFVQVRLGDKREPILKTPVMKHANQPIWESHTEFLVPEKHSTVVSLEVIDQKDFAVDPVLGRLSIKLTDLLEAKERNQDWLPLTGSRAGKIRVTAEWKPVAMTGSISGAAAYVPPIGVLRLWLKKAVDVKNVEATLGGKSDPYVRVLQNNKVVARTEVMSNNLNPEWDQIVYVPVHGTRERLMLELMDYQNIGKDRSLGHVEVQVGDFVEADLQNAKYPYKGTGRIAKTERIRLDATTYKGQLFFEADFNPGVSLRDGVQFDAQKNELELAAEQAPDGADIEVAATTVTDGAPSTPIKTHQPSQSVGGQSFFSVQSRASALSKTDSRSGNVTPVEATEGVVLSTEELLAAQSGVLVIQVVSGQLARRASLEVMIDDAYWPSFTTTKARSANATWDQVGEGFIRELDFGRVWLRLNAADDTDKEDIVAEFKMDARAFLAKTLNKQDDILLSLADGSNRSVVRVSTRYVPVDIALAARESINNMGVLRVEAVGAKNLHAGDRSGKSDPYVVFLLNGHKVFKTETIKKTLAPLWNESFEVIVPSRVAASFKYEIYDWNQVGTPTPLGDGTVDLASLEPFEQVQVTLPVMHDKHGEKGTLTLKLFFQPEFIARTRSKTGMGTFATSAGRAVSTIGGVPLNVGKGIAQGGVGVVTGVGHGVGAVGGFAGRRIGLIKKKDKSGKEVLVPDDGLTPVDENGAAAAAYDIPAGQASMTGDGVMSAGGSGQSNTEPGTLVVTVLGAKDLQPQGSHSAKDLKPYAVVKLGGKSHKTDHVKGVEPEWNAALSFNVAPGTDAFTATVLDHHTLGKDAELGEAQVNIWRHLHPAAGANAADVQVELTHGSGLLRLRLEWTPGANALSRLASRGRTPSIGSMKEAGSPSRFSLTPRKKADKE